MASHHLKYNTLPFLRIFRHGPCSLPPHPARIAVLPHFPLSFHPCNFIITLYYYFSFHGRRRQEVGRLRSSDDFGPVSNLPYADLFYFLH